MPWAHRQPAKRTQEAPKHAAKVLCQALARSVRRALPDTCQKRVMSTSARRRAAQQDNARRSTLRMCRKHTRSTQAARQENARSTPGACQKHARSMHARSMPPARYTPEARNEQVSKSSGRRHAAQHAGQWQNEHAPAKRTQEAARSMLPARCQTRREHAMNTSMMRSTSMRKVYWPGFDMGLTYEESLRALGRLGRGNPQGIRKVQGPNAAKGPRPGQFN